MNLPPLPDDRRHCHDAAYSADQMRAYGEACAAAALEEAAEILMANLGNVRTARPAYFAQIIRAMKVNT